MISCIPACLHHQRMCAYDEAKKKGIPNTLKYVADQKLRAHYRCCVFKWAGPREAQKWSLICRVSPRIAKKFKEVPNCLRTMLGMKVKFESRASCIDPDYTSLLPVAFENVVTDYVASWRTFGNQQKLAH